MSWFSDFAKSALSEAQKRIDKVLDIEDDAGNTLKSDPSYKLSDSSKRFMLYWYFIIRLQFSLIAKLLFYFCCKYL